MLLADAYKTLGIEPNATASEVKLAHRALLKKWHPDLNPDNVEESTKKTAEINAALDRIQSGEPDQQTPNNGPHQWEFHNVDQATMDEIIRNFTHGQFGGFGFNHPRIVPTIHQLIELPVSAFIEGFTFNFRYDRYRCTMEGEIQAEKRTERIVMEPDTPIHTQFVFPGVGNQPHPTHPPGNFILTVKPKSDASFDINGLTLSKTIKINCIEACLGHEIPVDLPGGESKTLKIKPGTQYGTPFRVRGKGLRDAHDRRGDFEVIIDIFTPTFTDGQRELLQKAMDEINGTQRIE